jgi:hypothetical protein
MEARIRSRLKLGRGYGLAKPKVMIPKLTPKQHRLVAYGLLCWELVIFHQILVSLGALTTSRHEGLTIMLLGLGGDDFYY